VRSDSDTDAEMEDTGEQAPDPDGGGAHDELAHAGAAEGHGDDSAGERRMPWQELRTLQVGQKWSL
jgi:hypothetical protein